MKLIPWKSRRTIVIALVNTLIAIAYSLVFQMNRDFLVYYFVAIYMLFTIVLILICQTENYRNETSTYVLLRKSRKEVSRSIVRHDIETAIVFAAESIVTANLITFFRGSALPDQFWLVYYRILIWPIFYTSLKEILYDLLPGYTKPTVIVCTIAILLRIIILNVDSRTFDIMKLGTDAAITIASCVLLTLALILPIRIRLVEE